MSAPFGRRHLSAEGLLRTARGVCAAIPDAPGQDIVLQPASFCSEIAALKLSRKEGDAAAG